MQPVKNILIRARRCGAQEDMSGYWSVSMDMLVLTVGGRGEAAGGFFVCNSLTVHNDQPHQTRSFSLLKIGQPHAKKGQTDERGAHRMCFLLLFITPSATLLWHCSVTLFS